MARRKTSGTAPAGETPIEALLHRDTRKNIPTREQGEYLQDEEEAAPQMLYPRDPTLDPQLVWKGKDEQDRKDLAVPVVPIYIQETIHPKALVEDLRARAAGKKPQLDLFADLQSQREVEEQVEFYQHEDHWRNRMILGDSLVVMTSLAQKEGLKGKVQMIYMDPPYGIDFGSNWQVSTRKRDVKDGKADDLVRQPEQIKAFRDTWQLGIHSYLSYMRDRLHAAHALLADTGSLFVQISTENLDYLGLILDEIFGHHNRVELISFRKKTMPLGGALLEGNCDYLLWYAKDKSQIKYRALYQDSIVEGDSHWNHVEFETGERQQMAAHQIADHSTLPLRSHVYQLIGMYPTGTFATGIYDFEHEGTVYKLPHGKCWKTPVSGMLRLAASNRLQPYSSGSTLRYVLKHSDYPITPLNNVWQDTSAPSDKIYVVQTSTLVIQRCMLMTTDPGDLVLDPTCGSGTTAFVAEQWGRRWITTDTSRVSMALARTRLMVSKYPYYQLADSGHGHAAQVRPSNLEGDVRAGFIYSHAPHITLKSIAHNEEIDTIHARFHEQLEPLRASLNKLLKKKYEEWEIPRDPDSSWPAEAKAAHSEWWQLRRARQQEIDASISRRAESEILYDQPEEDKKRIRVSGPFTVESLSPHRMLDASVPQPRSAANADAGSFVTTILDNLKKAGVQNTVKGERLVFDRLNIFPSKWIAGDGEITDKTGTMKRVAVCIGPEHGTVSPTLVRNAAKEALKGFDMVVVCGFAFDPLAYETAKEFAPPNGDGNGHGKAGAGAAGKTIPVLLSRMNPDLAMGDELLKKTGAGNLFMVFGEPDVAVEKTGDGKLTVELRGLDVYDPTTGEIRGHTTADIACWFIDTDYDGDSFFVRHAYFTGANDPYEKLKRALKAEIDETTWATLYTTKSRPFDLPKSGHFAVKVINHYGDEVLKVYPVR